VRFLRFAALAVAAWLVACVAALVALNVVDPPTTAVQLERRVESWFDERPYRKQWRPVPLGRISDHLEHAVVAAEDGRFWQHPGVDWKAVGEAVDDNRRRRSWRGGSTLTQQLVKNLFLTTRGSFARKAAEVPLAYTADLVLPKRRILELYLNVVEWDRGVYGAEAAARHHYGVSAAVLSREQAAGLASVLPDPRRRRPQRMERYRGMILRRMQQHGW